MCPYMHVDIRTKADLEGRMDGMVIAIHLGLHLFNMLTYSYKRNMSINIKNLQPI